MPPSSHLSTVEICPACNAEWLTDADRCRQALDEAVELLKRWQYNDTTSPGPVEETGEFLERAHYAPERNA